MSVSIRDKVVAGFSSGLGIIVTQGNWSRRQAYPQTRDVSTLKLILLYMYITRFLLKRLSLHYRFDRRIHDIILLLLDKRTWILLRRQFERFGIIKSPFTDVTAEKQSIALESILRHCKLLEAMGVNAVNDD